MSLSSTTGLNSTLINSGINMNATPSSSSSSSSSGASMRREVGIGVGMVACSSSRTPFLSNTTSTASSHGAMMCHLRYRHHHNRHNHHHHHHHHNHNFDNSARYRVGLGCSITNCCNRHHCSNQREILTLSTSSSLPSSSSSTSSSANPCCSSLSSSSSSIISSSFSSLDSVNTNRAVVDTSARLISTASSSLSAAISPPLDSLPSTGYGHGRHHRRSSPTRLVNFNQTTSFLAATATLPAATTLFMQSPLQPLSKFVSTVSSSSLASSSSSSSTLASSNLSESVSTSSRLDWFTYDFKIDNIQELIRLHENQQSFIQSPIFLFTNHLINVTPSIVLPVATNCTSPVFNLNSEPITASCSASASSTASTCMSKQPSSWRLIFYPNGAGTDCKNFLSVFLKYLSDEPVKIEMMFSIVDNQNEEVYVKYTVNKFNNSADWGFKQPIHKNAIIYQKEKFIKPYNGGSLLVRVKMRLDEHKHDYIKKLNENLHYCKLLSENFSQYYYSSGSSIDIAAVESSSPSSSSTSPLTHAQVSSSFGSSTSLMCNTLSKASLSIESNKHSTTLGSLENINSLNNSYYDLVLLVRSSLNPTDSCSLSAERNTVGQKRSLDQSPLSNKRTKCSHDSTGVFSKNAIDQTETVSSNENDDFIELRVHKCILAARSPVFKAMFNYRLKENLTNRVIIEDFRADVVKAMLKYIYTAYLPDDIKFIAIDLYIAAEKYFIESLKIKCREYIIENLSLDNVIQTYILAELYNDSMLRKQSLKYINENIDKVTALTEWNEFMAIYPQFFSNAFIRICKKDF